MRCGASRKRAGAVLGEGQGAAIGAADPAPARLRPRASGRLRQGTIRRSPFWREHALACLGCGACAYTCPVCHCFDIVDEGNAREGVRARNWDACQFPLFTLHASGHNPRGEQGGAPAAAHLSQVLRVSGKVRRDPVHRLRQLRAQLPGGAGRFAGGRRRFPMPNLYKPDLMEVIGVRQHTPDVKSVQPAFSGCRARPPVHLPRGPVRHLLGLRRRRIHLQHLLQLQLARLHRVLLPQGGARHRSAVAHRGGRYDRLPRPLRQRLSRWKRGAERT